MKLIKMGTIEDGVVKDFIIDCEGGNVDLDELIAFTKIKSIGHIKEAEHK